MKKAFCISLFIVFLVSMVLTGCKKLISIGTPQDQLVTSSVFTDTVTAEAAVIGMYAKAANLNPGVDFSEATCLFDGLSSDEGYFFPYTLYDPFTQNALTPSFFYPDLYWQSLYNTIYVANALISGDSASSLPPAYVARTVGEAKFIRSLIYFYLVNNFGPVPLVLTSNVQVATNLPRDSAGAVYAQITKDLTDAMAVLPADFSLYGGHPTRATSWAAEALLARVYLYTHNWAQAQTMASAVISNPGLFSIQPALTQVFLANSTEGIMQFETSITTNWIASNMGSASYSPTPNFVLSDSLYAAFEPGDLRLTNWVGIKSYGGKNYPYPAKYTYIFGSGAVQYDQVLRLAEQYLIRAEAETQQGDYTAAAADIDVVRTRAGLPNTTASDKASLLAALEQENRIEFFCEYGHRWMDLNRWPGVANPAVHRADEVYPVDKSTPWQPYDALWPIPLSEITANPNLTQNPGYN
jgi:hypothetical protein